jgi:hypothetical protein
MHSMTWQALCSSPYGEAQALDIYGQCARGARYLDLRVVHERGSFFTAHGMAGACFEDILTQVACFLDEHPTEVVICDFNHFHRFECAVRLPPGHVTCHVTCHVMHRIVRDYHLLPSACAAFFVYPCGHCARSCNRVTRRGRNSRDPGSWRTITNSWT